MPTDQTAARAEMEQALVAMLAEDRWRHLLDLRANPAHRYSLGNLAWLEVQAAHRGFGLREVRGYRAWEAVGRHVCRGETSLRVVAPVTRKEVDKQTGEERRRLVGWRAAAVFDVSQTDGPELPDVTPISGVDPADLADRCVALLRDDYGYTTATAPLPPGVNGQADRTAKTVTLSPALSPAARAKTTAHELAHVALDHHARLADGEIGRHRAEQEAESVAYLLCRRTGIDSADYSLGYLAAWASAADPSEVVAEVMATASAVTAAADRLAGQLGLDVPADPTGSTQPTRRVAEAVVEAAASLELVR